MRASYWVHFALFIILASRPTYGRMRLTLGSNRFVQFDRQILRHDFTAVNTTLTVGNRDLADASGHGLGRLNPLNTRSIGWIPTALTIFFIASSPLSWQRKACALVAGWVLVHGLILFSLQTLIFRPAPRK